MVALAGAAAVITGAFGADEPPSPGAAAGHLSDENASRAATPTRVPAVASRRPRPTEMADPRAEVTGFAYPIEGACLPEDDSLMPGAPREYRNGVHEGVDFYDADNCAFIGLDTEVLAAKAGTIIRADRTYQEPNEETLTGLVDETKRAGGDDPVALDVFRGRQVWIDHGDGTVTRYAHLNGIAPGIEVGMKVEQGQLIGYVGESGTVDPHDAPGSEAHLHLEIRVDDGFLGAGLNPASVRELYRRAFAP